MADKETTSTKQRTPAQKLVIGGLAVVLGGLALVFALPYIVYFFLGIAFEMGESKETPSPTARPTQAIMDAHGLPSSFPRAQVATNEILEYRNLDSEEELLDALRVIRDYTPEDSSSNSRVEASFDDQLWSFTQHYHPDTAAQLIDLGEGLNRGMFGPDSIVLRIDCEDAMPECVDDLAVVATDMIDVASSANVEVYHQINLTVEGDKHFTMVMWSEEDKDSTMQRFRELITTVDPQFGGTHHYFADGTEKHGGSGVRR